MALFGLINPLVQLALSVKSRPVFLAVALMWRYGRERMHLLQTLGHPTVDKPTHLSDIRPHSDSQFLCAKSEQVGNIVYFVGVNKSYATRQTWLSGGSYQYVLVFRS
jgi:uncharacterized membrane protein YwaF